MRSSQLGFCSCDEVLFGTRLLGFNMFACFISLCTLISFLCLKTCCSCWIDKFLPWLVNAHCSFMWKDRKCWYHLWMYHGMKRRREKDRKTTFWKNSRLLTAAEDKVLYCVAIADELSIRSSNMRLAMSEILLCSKPGTVSAKKGGKWQKGWCCVFHWKGGVLLLLDIIRVTWEIILCFLLKCEAYISFLKLSWLWKTKGISNREPPASWPWT